MPTRVKDLIEELKKLDQDSWVWVSEGTWRGKPYITTEPSPVSGKEDYVLHG